MPRESSQTVLLPREPSRRRVIILTGLAVLLPLSLTLYWLLPLFSAGSTIVPREEVESYPEFKGVERYLRSYLRGLLGPEPGKTANPIINHISESGTHRLNPLIFVEFVVDARPAPAQSVATTLRHPGRLRVRVDRLIWMLALSTFLGVAAYFFQIMPRSPISEASPQYQGASVDFQEVMQSEISRLTNLGDRLYQRSRLLLASGVLVAFSGVGALFFLIPNHFLLPSERLESGRVISEAQQDGPDKELLRDLQALLKASGLVLQIEVFAFILLRQYRSAFGDYTYFHNLRLRYVHYLAASKALLSMQDPLWAQTGVYMANFLLGGDSFSAAARKPGAQDSESDGTDGLPPPLDRLFPDLRLGRSGKTTSGNGGTS